MATKKSKADQPIEHVPGQMPLWPARDEQETEHANGLADFVVIDLTPQREDQ